VSKQAFLRKGTRLARLRRLKPLLAKWIAINSTIAAEWIEDAQDVPWWYNERASLSIFAGAVWRCSGWAFEEFAVAKQVATPGRKRSEHGGRCDINFVVDGQEYVAEAKQAWPNIEAPASAKRVIDAAVAGALHDAKEIAHWELPALAMVFLSPRLRTTYVGEMDRFLGLFIDELLSIRNATVAWTFPPAARHMSPEGRNSHRCYPGVALVILRAA